MDTLKHVSPPGSTICDDKDVCDEIDVIMQRIMKPVLGETDSSTCSSKQNNPNFPASGLRSPRSNIWQQKQQQQPPQPPTKSTRRSFLKNKKQPTEGTLLPPTKSTPRSILTNEKPSTAGIPTLTERFHSSVPNMNVPQRQRLDRAQLMTKSKSVSDLGRKVRHIESAREMAMKKSMKSRFLQAKCGVYVLAELTTATAARASKVEANRVVTSSDLPSRGAVATHHNNKKKPSKPAGTGQEPNKPECKKNLWEFDELSISSDEKMENSLWNFDDLSVLTDDKTVQVEYIEDFPVNSNTKCSPFHHRRRKQPSPAQNIRLAPTMAEF